MTSQTLSGLWKITRPGNMLICALSVLCGGIIGGKPSGQLLSLIKMENPGEFYALVCAMLSASLILAAGNVLNDVRDVTCDKINAPWRPIPSGIITQKAALLYSGFLALAGVLFSLPLGIKGISIALTAVVILALYDLRLKGVPLAGNIAVSLLGGLAFIYGGIAGGAVSNSIIPAVFAFLFHLGRELIKDASDFEGDSAAGIKTAATVWGKKRACFLAGTVLIVLLIATLIPYLNGIFTGGYITLIFIGIWPVVIASVWSINSNQSSGNLRKVSTVLKFVMPLGILSVLAGFQGL